MVPFLDVGSPVCFAEMTSYGTPLNIILKTSSVTHELFPRVRHFSRAHYLKIPYSFIYRPLTCFLAWNSLPAPPPAYSISPVYLYPLLCSSQNLGLKLDFPITWFAPLLYIEPEVIVNLGKDTCHQQVLVSRKKWVHLGIEKWKCKPSDGIWGCLGRK